MGKKSPSPATQATQQRRLSTKMKPKLKVKSPDVPPSKSRRVPLLKQLTSTLTKASSPFTSKTSRVSDIVKSFEEASNSTRTLGKTSSRMGTRSQAKHSGLKWEPSRNTEKGQDAKIQGERSDNELDMSPITKAVVPKVSVTSRQDPPITRELRKRTVQRSKVKSPICQLKVCRRREKVMSADICGKEKMPRGSNILEEDLASTTKGKTPRTRMEELVQQGKKKDAEILSLTRKLNATQKTLTEKEKLVKDLETKIPGMLADLKKNLEADEVKKRMNRDLKESVKRNKSLTDTKKQVEEQLKSKEEKYQSLLAVKKKSDALLKEKQKELKSQDQNILTMERTILDLEKKLSLAIVDVEREKERRGNIEIRCHNLVDDLGDREGFIERLRTELFHANNVAATRENEFEGLKKQNLELQWVIHNQEVRRAQTCEECRRRLEGAQIDRGVDENSGYIFSSEDNLNRGSAFSRDENASINLTRGQRSSLVGHLVNGRADFGVTYNTDNLGFAEERSIEDNLEGGDDSHDMQVESDASAEVSVYDALSSGTCRRLDLLDDNVERLWSKLSTKDEASNSLALGKASFTDSVSRLEKDLDQSVLQHSSLLRRAGAVKRLFD